MANEPPRLDSDDIMTDATVPISLEEQVQKITSLAQQDWMAEGVRGYVVSMKWLRRVLAKSGPGDYSKEEKLGEIGPLDNTDLWLDEDGSLQDEQGNTFVAMKPGATADQDYELVPEAAWNLIIKWYGLAQGSPTIIRFCHDTSPPGVQPNLMFEVYPPVFCIYKLSPETSTRLLASRHQSFNTFLKAAKTLVGIENKVRVWRILDSAGFEPAYFASLEDQVQRELLDVRDETANANYNGHATMDLVGLRQSDTLVLEEMVGGPGGGEWPSNNKAKIARSRSPAKLMTRGRQSKSGKSRGSVGLGNLGNTCYMNSALQCVRSVKELTLYFLDNKHKTELNPSNPLGNNGEIAKAYGKLLHEMYQLKGSSSFTPRSFKNVVGRYGPSFSGYQQQDSQEFLLFLLDGLQEDLNRIEQKPYIEKPDSTDEMVHDLQALREMADQCWEIYKKRNDSVITDLFAGMYKSTLHCPVCSKVSIIFDPFNNLTLQLPIQSVWSKTVQVYPIGRPPFQMVVEVSKNATWANVAEFISRRTSSDPTKLILAEIWQKKFYKFFEPRGCVAEDNVSDADTLGCFQLEEKPTNFPAPQKSRRSYQSYGHHDDIPVGHSPLADKMLVSVFHRKPKLGSSQKEYFGDPTLVILTREESRDRDSIMKRCLSRIEGMTSRDFLREDESDPDDAIQTRSIDGEDGVVNITLQKPVANMLKPETSISPGIRHLFDIKLGTSRTQMVPTGSEGFGIDPNALLVGLGIKEATTFAAGPVQVTPPTSDEDEPTIVPSLDDESSDGLPEVEQIVQPPIDPVEQEPARRKGKSILYKNRRGDGQSSIEPERPTDGQLVHLGQSLVLDWTKDGYDALFAGADSMTDSRGRPTWTNLPIHSDAELEAKQKARASKRKTGFSLGDCLDEFRKPEILSENDAWYCPRCKEHRRASKTFELWKAPDILVIHLKRFSTQGRFNNKLDFMVDFPLDGLDLSSRLARDQEGKSPVYELFAVDNHYGGLGGGHYTAFAKNFVDQNWYEYNDSFVSRKDEKAVITPAAYLLFYRRKSEQSLGGSTFERSSEISPSLSDSLPASRANSPFSGEGRRLDEGSHTGLSSAFPGANTALETTISIPSQSQQTISDPGLSREDDEDEGIGMMEDDHTERIAGPTYNLEQGWSFGALQQPQQQVPEGPARSDDEANSLQAESDGSPASARMEQFSDADPDAVEFGSPTRRPTDTIDPAL